MTTEDLTGLLEFLRAAEQLKTVKRSGWTSAGEQESVAEHTWRVCLMALLVRDSYPGLDFAKLVSLCIVHDLGEAIGGDIPAPQQVGGPAKSAQEREDLLQLVQPLPDLIREQLTALWDEYEAATTPEARLAKALDKLETILQHNQGSNPSDFDYRFNLAYGQRFTNSDPLIRAIRQLLDAETERLARDAGASTSKPAPFRPF